MAGCWESQASVLCCILHTENTTMAWSLGLRNLIIPGGILPLSGMPFDHARNAGFMATLDSGASHCFFLDSDVIPPRDAVLRLLARKKPIISGVYHRRSPPHGIPVMLKNRQWITQYPKNEVIEVDLVGAGCLLVQRDVIQKMPPIRKDAGKHWFSWQTDMKDLLPDYECLSEDFAFNYYVKKSLGIPTLVDTSIICRHVGYAEATYNSLLPLRTEVNT